MNINEMLQLAFKQHQSGNLTKAERIYKNILKKNNDSFDALHMLGVLFAQLGKHDSAIKYIEKALMINPNNSNAKYNLGKAFQEKRQFDRAITCFRKVIELNPEFAIAYYDLANILFGKGQLDEAIALYQTALRLNPDYVEAYNNLGIVLQGKGQLDEAANCYKKTLQLNPDYVEAYNNLGIILQGKGQLDEAIALYQKALKISPIRADVYNNLGNALREKGLLEEATICYQKTLEINPNHADANYNFGSVLRECGRSDEAIAAFDKALDYKKNNITALWAKCMSLLPIIQPDQTSIHTSRQCYHDELIKLRNTVSVETPQVIAEAVKAIGSHQPFYLAYQGLNDKELQQTYGELVCKIMAAKFPQWEISSAMPPLVPGEPIRVGIVSGYFHRHSVWKIPMKGWIENLSRHRFSLYGYSTGKKKDKETEAAQKYFERFIGNIYSFENLCQVIRDDNLHVLIYPEIGMNPETLRLAALRLAPVQCASWGHPETTGLPTIDYYLSSDLMEPPDAEEHYTETLVRLPNLSIYYLPLDVPHAKINRETFDLRTGSVLYHCCQALYKYLPQYDEVFPRIAGQVSNCQFLFSSYPKSSYLIEKFRLRMRQTFTRYGMNADDYVVFMPFLEESQYDSLYGLVDVFLDPIGWSGCNSALEAIAYNLPVVTFPGKLMRSRDSSAILTMMKFTETIATTLDKYIDISVQLGQSPEWRKTISDKTAANKPLVYRDKACIAALEDFLERVVRKRLGQAYKR